MSKYKLILGKATKYEDDNPKITKLKKRYDHTYVIGKTGRGKSSLLENMAVYDINYGCATIFIDPSGISCRKIYHKIEDKSRVIYISIESPKVINPINKEGYKIDTIIQEFIQVLDVLVTLTNSNPESTVQMKEIINYAIRSITKEENKNLKYITDLLMYKDDRIKLVNELFLNKMMEEHKYWKEFDESDNRYPRNKEKIESAKRVAARLSEISTGEMKDFVIGKNEINLEEIVEEGKVLLVDTSRMNLNSKIYITNLLVYAVLSYSDYTPNKYRTEDKQKPLLVYVDEFAIVVSELFDTLLASARKSAVGFTLAHQNFSQIPEKILDTTIGNADTYVVLTCGDKEASRFSKIFNVEMLDLLDLDPYNAYIRIGKTNCLAELFKPIMNEVPPLPDTIISPKVELNFLSPDWMFDTLEV